VSGWQHIVGVVALSVALVGLSAGVSMADPAVSSAPLPAANDEMPWYRSFTVRSSEVENGAFLPLKRPDAEFRASSQWGITIGLEEQDPVLESTDRMSAGAFYEFSPRFRLGGELSFVAPGDLRISTPEDRILSVGPGNENPVIRIESSIKF